MSPHRFTREEIVQAIRQCYHKLGHVPTKADLWKLARIGATRVAYAFGSFGEAVRDAGLEPRGTGFQISAGKLLCDWAVVARKLGRLPSRDQYASRGHYSPMPFEARWKSWRAIPEVFARYAAESCVQHEWLDVVMLIEAARPAIDVRTRGEDALSSSPQPFAAFAGSSAARIHDWLSLAAQSVLSGSARSGKSGSICAKDPRSPSSSSRSPKNSGRGRRDARVLASPGACIRGPLFAQRPVYGAPLLLPGLTHEPVNESGVVFVFGMLAHHMGFVVQRMQTAFPDCEAMREIMPGRWQRVAIEFEYESRNFQRHGHEARKCDLIVCWLHNWPECPPPLEVIELRRIMGHMG